MKLSTLYTAVPEYIEFAWVTTPNASGQSITANTITPLTLDTEVADTGSLVSAPTSNQFTLPAGTYYFEATAPIIGATAQVILGLYNTTTSSFVSRTKATTTSTGNTASYFTYYHNLPLILSGQFAITGNNTYDLRALPSVDVTNGVGSLTAFTNSTAGADQRTTIKLWKLK